MSSAEDECAQREQKVLRRFESWDDEGRSHQPFRHPRLNPNNVYSGWLCPINLFFAFRGALFVCLLFVADVVFREGCFWCFYLGGVGWVGGERGLTYQVYTFPYCKIIRIDYENDRVEPFVWICICREA